MLRDEHDQLTDQGSVCGDVAAAASSSLQGSITPTLNTNRAVVVTFGWMFISMALSSCDGASISDSGPVPEPEPDAVFTTTRVVAGAGADREVLEGSRIVLDGFASRALDGTLELTWSQTDGVPVLLTNPSGANPAFIAPLAPDVLRFQLRAQSGDEVDTDEVVITISDSPTRSPFYLQTPADSVAITGDVVTYSVDVVGSTSPTTSFFVEALCNAEAVVSNSGEVSVFLEDQLPCAIVVDVEDDDENRGSRSIHVIWPQDTPLAPATVFLQTPTLLLPGESAALRYDVSDLAATGGTVRTWTPGELLNIESLLTSTEVVFNAPLRRGRLAFLGETRLGPVSGGIKVVLVEVSAGAGNRAPVASGGPPREVQPGGSFAIDPSLTFDLDNDPLEIRAIQVLGQAALADETQPFTFQAPDVEGTLLFHVVANDGVVDSAPSSVVVFVSETAANTPPQLNLTPLRYVQPGIEFVLDATSATDNSGVIDRFSISQEPADDSVLLAEPFDGPSVTLTAGVEGAVYHFRLSAFDVQGLQGFADVEVRVETAGPYVDPIRGLEDGDGTTGAPFATLAAAVDVAMRHQLPELRLTSGLQTPWTGEYPEGISLRGGFSFDGTAYIESIDEEEVPTTLPVGESGIVFNNSSIENVEIRLSAPDAALRLRGSSTLVRVDVSETAIHTGSLVVIEPGASVTLTGGSITPSAVVEVDIGNGRVSTLEVRGSDLAFPTTLGLSQVTIGAGSGGERIGVSCENADVSISEGSLTAGHDAVTAIGIAATDCTLELLGTIVVAGDGVGAATGLDLERTVVFVDDTSAVVAVADDGDAIANINPVENATAVRHRGASPGIIRGTLSTYDDVETPVRAIGLLAESSLLRLEGATILARATSTSTAVEVRANSAQFSGSRFDADIVGDDGIGEATGVRILGTGLLLDSCDVVANGANAQGISSDPLVLADDLRLLLSNVSVTGSLSAVGVGLANASGVLVSGTTIDVTGLGIAAPVRGISAAQGTIRSSLVFANAILDVTGVVLGSGSSESLVERSEVDVESQTESATALLSAGGLRVSSAALFASVRETEKIALALEARESLQLIHGTLFANTTAVTLRNPGATTFIANTALSAPTALFLGPSVDPFETVGVAFDTTLYLDDGTTQFDSLALINGLFGCTGCIDFVRANTVDDRGRLTEGANVLVDAAAASLADDTDIDGDPRPQGSAPDIGCDERLSE